MNKISWADIYKVNKTVFCVMIVLLVAFLFTQVLEIIYNKCVLFCDRSYDLAMPFRLFGSLLSFTAIVFFIGKNKLLSYPPGRRLVLLTASALFSWYVGNILIGVIIFSTDYLAIYLFNPELLQNWHL